MLEQRGEHLARLLLQTHLPPVAIHVARGKVDSNRPNRTRCGVAGIKCAECTAGHPRWQVVAGLCLGGSPRFHWHSTSGASTRSPMRPTVSRPGGIVMSNPLAHLRYALTAALLASAGGAAARQGTRPGTQSTI